ncbi:PREDICTED: uncharacterized protein LOC108446654 [Corvus brachyrhynchos]|uniref:uncharacterized protein LOC108446654 n=1 Tax=Corvus brachyrhynchos TaxID=85066 RepID=UPI0008165A00|nr:PREDICTED: uncharacterized protein LOC108446654 [Corvus brachyrhynchos]
MSSEGALREQGASRHRRIDSPGTRPQAEGGGADRTRSHPGPEPVTARLSRGCREVSAGIGPARLTPRPRIRLPGCLKAKVAFYELLRAQFGAFAAAHPSRSPAYPAPPGKVRAPDGPAAGGYSKLICTRGFGSCWKRLERSSETGDNHEGVHGGTFTAEDWHLVSSS